MLVFGIQKVHSAFAHSSVCQDRGRHGSGQEHTRVHQRSDQEEFCEAQMEGKSSWTLDGLKCLISAICFLLHKHGEMLEV